MKILEIWFYMSFPQELCNLMYFMWLDLQMYCSDFLQTYIDCIYNPNKLAFEVIHSKCIEFGPLQVSLISNSTELGTWTPHTKIFFSLQIRTNMFFWTVFFSA